MFFRYQTGFLRKHDRISKGALERSSSNLREKVIPRLRSHVSTLDPNKFAEKKQQRFDIGDMKAVRLYNHPDPVTPPLLKLSYDNKTELGKHVVVPFPPDTRGFLYYFTPPERPRIGGELRFRVTSSDDLASFESGSDLLKRNGLPWSRPLIAVSKFSSYTLLYNKLREEGFVPDDLHALLSTLPNISPKYRRSQFLSTLGDTFIIDFSFSQQGLSVITEQGIMTLTFTGPFFERIGGRRRTIPYTGSALVRFERSTLPEHEGTRTAVLRFLKIITPVECVVPNYDGKIVLPKEGELHRRFPAYHRDADVEVWGLNIDQKNGMVRGLQLLWDT